MDINMRAEELARIADSYRNQGQIAKAQVAYQEVITSENERGSTDPKIVDHCRRMIGVSMAMENDPKVFGYLDSIKGLILEESQPALLRDCGIAHLNAGNLVEAEALFNESLALSDERGDRRNSGVTGGKMAVLFCSKGWLSDAEVFLHVAFKDLQEGAEEDKFSFLTLKMHRAYYYLKIGSLTEAGEDLRDADALPVDCWWRQAELAGHWAWLHFQRGDEAQGFESLGSFSAFLTKIQPSPGALEVLLKKSCLTHINRGFG